MKKILFVGRNLGLGSGHAKPALLLADELRKLGLNVKILTDRNVEKSLPKDKLLKEGLSELDFSFRLDDDGYVRRLLRKAEIIHLFDLLTFRRLKKIFALEGKKVFYSLNAPLKTSFRDVLNLGFSGFRALLRKNALKATLVPKFLYKRLIKDFDLVFSWSHLGVDWLESIGIEEKKIKHLPMPVNGSSISFVKPRNKKSLTYGHFGWASQIRGTRDVIESFIPFCGTRHRLKIHVRSLRKTEKNLLNFFKKKSCTNMEFKIQKYDDINDFLKKCDVMVLPFRAAFCVQPPLAVFEAMLAGIPVISTNSTSIPEIITDGKTGLLVPVKDVASLCEAMESLENFDLRQTLGKNARDYVLREHRPKKVAKIYKKLMLRYL